jgi:hypothetical protein
MLEKSLGLLFFLKQTKSQIDDLIFIYLKITVDGKSNELSTKRKCAQSRWNPGAGREMGNKESTKELNYYLDSLEQLVYQAKRSLFDTDKPVTAQAIKDVLNGVTEKPRMILEIFKHHNDQMKALEGIDFAPGTIGRYEISKQHTRDFIKWMYKVDDKPIKELDHKFISQYAFWLKTVRKCNNNSTMKYLANFKKVVLICVKKEKSCPEKNLVENATIIGQWKLDSIQLDVFDATTGAPKAIKTMMFHESKRLFLPLMDLTVLIIHMAALL